MFNIFKKENNNPLRENELVSQIHWKEFYEKEDFTQPEFYSREPKLNKIENIMEQNTFQSREPSGPLSKIDQSWEKNLKFLTNEIDAAEKQLELSIGKLEKAKDDLRSAEILNQDCNKKVYALKDAFGKLNSLVPFDKCDKQEPELLLEKTSAKKAAKKATTTRKNK